MPVCIHLALAVVPCSLAQTTATSKACHSFLFAVFLHYPSGCVYVSLCVYIYLCFHFSSPQLDFRTLERGIGFLHRCLRICFGTKTNLSPSFIIIKDRDKLEHLGQVASLFRASVSSLTKSGSLLILLLKVRHERKMYRVYILFIIAECLAYNECLKVDESGSYC